MIANAITNEPRDAIRFFAPFGQISHISPAPPPPAGAARAHTRLQRGHTRAARAILTSQTSNHFGKPGLPLRPRLLPSRRSFAQRHAQRLGHHLRPQLKPDCCGSSR